MKTTFYTVIENLISPEGTKELLYNHFDEDMSAYAKYYMVCAQAAISGNPYHSAILLRSDGRIIEGRVFDRRTDETDGGDE